MARKKLLHLKSGVVNQDGTPKLPTSEQIDLGEIAVNYAEGHETLAIKNSSGDVVSFSNDQTIMDYIDKHTQDEVTIKYSGDPDPSIGSHIEIFIDDTVDPAEVDVYTQAQVDDKIDGVVQINESGDTFNATVVVDETEDLEVEFYTQAQVDAIIQKLKDDNHLI